MQGRYRRPMPLTPAPSYTQREHPSPHGTVTRKQREREANAKWSRVHLLIHQVEQHVRPYTQSATDEPFLNRESQEQYLMSALPTR